MKIQRSLFAFLAITLVHLTGQLLADPILHNSTKPLLIPALAYFFWKETLKTPLNKFVYAALFFSWLGDSFLIFAPWNGLYFMLGLGAFLIAQLIYIIINISFVNEGQSRLVFKWPATLFILYGAGFFSLIIDSLGLLTLPVAIYCAVITLMGVTAVGRIGRTESKAALLVIFGAALFILSDSVIAYNKFVAGLEWSGPIVMSTYLAAQYLLVRGYMRFIESLKAA